MTGLPLLVVGGYLGAGKTTLIRQLLQNAGGLRLLVLVNDFGNINIDADLIAEADGDTIALSNGCVCCAMSGDLYYAIGDALDRTPRPDLVIVEASGVGDPARIAAVARTEPDLRYSGIVTVADATSICNLLDDAQVGAQVAGQLSVADLVILSRPDATDTQSASARISKLTDAAIVTARYGQVDIKLLSGLRPTCAVSAADADHHTTYVKWSGDLHGHIRPACLARFLQELPKGVFRLKGWINLPDRTIELHRVGATTDQSAMARRTNSNLVAIAPAGRFDPAEVQRAWDRMVAGQ